MPFAEVKPNNAMKETMNDFTNPLEAIREVIQNSSDSQSTIIKIDIRLNETSNGTSLDIIEEDNGEGLPFEKFKNFFNLGDSTKRDDPNTIGEKGHGTKILYNSNKITVESWINHKKYISIMQNPYQKLYDGLKLDYSDPKEIENIEKKYKGVRITVEGYLKNTSAEPYQKFAHASVRDYILWFTAFGSIKNQFYKDLNKSKKILLRSFDSKHKSTQNIFSINLNEEGYEEIPFGHVFPDKEYTKTADLKKLAKENNIRNWEDLFCKRLYCDEVSIDGISTPIQIVIWAEGDKFKKLYNPLIKERYTSSTRPFQYKVSDRYGFWACKNYIPIQNIDTWISGKGNYTKFHAFVNFDGFSLTANRSSIENTKPEYLKAISEKLDLIFSECTNKDSSYKEWLEVEVLAEHERSADEEKKEYKRRINACKKRKSLKIGKVRYFEPKYEGEVGLLFDGLLQVFPNILNYEILDYNTYKGIDFLIRKDEDDEKSIGYAELKLNLEKGRFNHSFEKLREIICYNKKGFLQGEIMTDLSEKHLKLTKNSNGWSLADHTGEVKHSIDIFVIEDFLNSVGLQFE